MNQACSVLAGYEFPSSKAHGNSAKSEVKEIPEGLRHRMKGFIFVCLVCISYRAVSGALQTHIKRLVFLLFEERIFLKLPFHIAG